MPTGYHTNGPAIGPDGMIYFAVGTATNRGVVGEDSATFGSLARHPDFCDIPAKDITLAGQNFTTKNVLPRRCPGSTNRTWPTAMWTRS